MVERKPSLPATDLASVVFPAPGGPPISRTRRSPIEPPTLWWPDRAEALRRNTHYGTAAVLDDDGLAPSIPRAVALLSIARSDLVRRDCRARGFRCGAALSVGPGGAGVGWPPVVAVGRLVVIDQADHPVSVTCRPAGIDHPVSSRPVSLRISQVEVSAASWTLIPR